ncbi:hypothetical protein FD30_GL001786 [Levilactobacillus namurensis DSM 19117]|uniref:Uncharacterized protein n=1 Tax=Levilactobacillus namurensis DSM 19117 TaxID=1423773 RepID=A0A0R1K7U8_9LACO|nr:hypothetical protein [Levilactobacillus namurensis]KRK75970.1 hypothetical protein FD30_GL001786 [Levilactobacillus namurensis DSM 19117]GEO74454.1 hypothetical protein LNA02_11520 [Levilactobacillus namurensis]
MAPTSSIQVYMASHTTFKKRRWGYRLALPDRTIRRTGATPYAYTGPAMGIVVLIKALRHLRRLRLTHFPLALTTNIKTVELVLTYQRLADWAAHDWPPTIELVDLWQLADAELRHFPAYTVQWTPDRYRRVDWLVKPTHPHRSQHHRRQ